MKANIKSISELTGYSIATVSKALNHKKGIREETAQEIFAAAEKLGYKPNTTVSKIYLIFFRNKARIIDDNLFCNLILSGVEQQAREAGLETSLIFLDKDNPDFHKILQDVLQDASAYTLIVGTEMQASDYQYFADAPNRLIVIDGMTNPYMPSVSIDNDNAAVSAVNYLIEHGHREIGYLRGQDRIHNFTERENGYYKAMRLAGLPVKPEYIYTIGTSIESAYNSLKAQAKDKDNLPTAFFADNDYIAIGAIRALQQLYYDIPDDISIISIDNIQHSAIIAPPLTSFDIHFEELGSIATELLLDDNYKKYPFAITTHLGSSLIERDSVKKL